MPINSIPNSTDYDATSAGPITSIDSLTTESGYNSLPSSGKIKYVLARSSGNITVSVFFRKNGDVISQSLFTLAGAAFAFTSSISSIFSFSNDDHDSLLMDADGAGLLGMSNNNSFASQTWSKFRASSILSQSVSLDSATTYPASSFVGTNGTLIAFPGTNSAVWISLSNSQYKVNNGSGTAWPAALSFLGTNSPTNSLWTISDGINQFMIGRYGSTSAAIVTANLLNNTISVTAITLTTAPAQSNTTEEDTLGTQLFVVDGVNTWHSGGSFYYGGTVGWKESRNIFDATGKSVISIGASTQTDMDVFGSIDATNYVWFADWGHDNGGLFNVGDDNTLGIRSTNIQTVPTIIGSGAIPEGITASSNSVVAGQTVTFTLGTLIPPNGNATVSYTITGNVLSTEINVALTGTITTVGNVGTISIGTLISPESAATARSFPNNAPVAIGGNVVVTQYNSGGNTTVTYQSFTKPAIESNISANLIAVKLDLPNLSAKSYSVSEFTISTVKSNLANVTGYSANREIRTIENLDVYAPKISVPTIIKTVTMSSDNIGYFVENGNAVFVAITNINDPRPIQVATDTDTGIKQRWF